MTKRQKMFHEIGMAFGRTPEERTEREDYNTEEGLCSAYYNTLYPKCRTEIIEEDAEHIYDRIFYKFHSTPGSLLWAPARGGTQGLQDIGFSRDPHDLWRSDFAFLLCEMSDEDYNLIVGE